MKRKIFEKLNIRENQKILEIGFGKSYFVEGFSSKVGKDGKIYYLDIDREELNRVRKINKINVEAHYLKGGEFNIKGELDIIFMKDSYNKFKNNPEYFRYIKKYLKAGGVLVIIEPDLGFNKNTFAGNFTKRDELVEDLVYSGFRLKNEYFFLKNTSFVIFEKE